MSESGIDWLKVVRLHKQIVATAQQDAYELAIPERGSRWTSLDDFEPDEMSGPWSIPLSSARTREFLKAVVTDRGGQCCLGGPGFLRFRKGQQAGEWQKLWSPLLYREVRIAEDGDALAITPVSSYWYLSPLILDRCSKKEIAVDAQESELVTQMLEAIGAGAGVMSERCLSAFLDRVPELTDDLRKTGRYGDTQPPAPWFLFQIPQKVSGYDQNLMRDYEAVERALQERPGQLGGLALLDRLAAVPAVPEEPPVPVVPLNAEQEEAVRRIVGTQPVIVVSGPPGCGKSQVVTSAIMNCWSRGKSVLFASTNNRAVDVVRERMERFEGQYPVAVRAGRKDLSNIDDVLGRTDDLGGQARQSGSAGPAVAAQTARDALISKRKALQFTLESEKPQRIDELIRAASQAYADQLAREQGVDDEVSRLHEELKQACEAALDQEPAQVAAASTGSWIASLNQFKLEAVQSRQRRDVLDRNCAVAVSRLQALLKELGISWNEQAPRPAWSHRGEIEQRLLQWKAQFLSATEGDLQQLWQPLPWERSFDRWANTDAARVTADDAEKVLGQLRVWKVDSAAEIRNVDMARRAEQAVRQIAVAAGVPPQLSKNLDVLKQWKTTWLARRSVKSSFLDWIGIGGREADAKEAFEQAEAKLQALLPTNFAGDLHALIDPAIDWAAACAEVARLEGAVAQREAQLYAAAAIALDEGAVDSPSDPSAWRAIEQKLHKLAALASRASEAIAARTIQRDRIESIQIRVVELQQAFADSPVLQAWGRLDGKAAWRLIAEMQSGGTAESIHELRSMVLTGLTEGMLSAVAAIATEFDRLGKIESDIRSCHTDEELIGRWLSERPRGGLSVNLEHPQAWPSDLWVAALQDRVDTVLRTCSRLSNIEQIERPKVAQLGVESLQWARERLLAAASELPSGQAEAAAEVIEAQTKAQEGWDITAIRKRFGALEPDALKAELAAVDRQLEAGSFAEGQQRWWDRLASDDDAYNAIGELRRRGRRTYWKLDSTDAATFARVLRLAPVWISTAQASQAIPVAPGLFDLVIIDEASQCTLTNILPLLFRAKRIAIIGDPHQLPAITSISQLQEEAIAREHDALDLVDRWGHCEGRGANDMYAVATRALPRRKADVIYLREHFRSHPQIIGFANHFIYSDGLRLKRESRDVRTTSISPGVHGVPVVGAAQRQDGSWVNPVEADAVIDLVQQLIGKGVGSSLGIVTPFRAQKELLVQRLAGITSDGERILVDTANGFQGDEREIIIFSPAIGPGMPTSTVRWAENPPNLVNVALTRARDALFVVSDFDFCGKQKGIFRNLADYCRRIERLRKSSVAELELYSWMVLEGWQPEAQAQVADHKVDFLLAAPTGRRVAIEIDGKQFHAGATQRDRAIDAALAGAGLTVLRVSGREALETPQTVIEKIRKLMAA